MVLRTAEYPLQHVQLFRRCSLPPETSHNGEKPHPSAPRCPENVRIFIPIAYLDLTVRRDNFQLRNPSIRGQSPSREKPALPPGKKEPTEPNCWRVPERKE